MARQRHIDKVEIKRIGEAMIIPDSMSLEEAAKSIALKIREEEEYTNFNAEINAFPYDGAYALAKAMEAQFGVVIAKPKMGWFGKTPPASVTVEINDNGDTVQVPWGQFSIPAWGEGTVETKHTFSDGKLVFVIRADIKRKYQLQFEELVRRTKEIVLTQSIYRGHAIRIKFQELKDEAGNKVGDIPDIRFIKVRNATKPIFTLFLEDQLEFDVLMYIRHADAVKQMQGGNIKRGVLFAGKYGTGKTLSANWIAKVAEEHGWTFIYVLAKDIPYALDFARTYQPCVVFAEDIDSVAGTDRSEGVNVLLNRLDGVDAKRHDILFVATTNHVDSINAAMLRPGRIDVVMVVEPPDAEAAIRIAKHYAGTAMDQDDDYTEAGKILADRIPAEIEEVVKRAQTRALARTGVPSTPINGEDLKNAAIAVKREKELVNAKDKKVDPVKEFGESIGVGLGSTLGTTITTIMQERQVQQADMEKAQRLLLSIAAEGHRTIEASKADKAEAEAEKADRVEEALES